MDNQILELLIKAKDEATATLNAVGKEVDDVAKKSGNLSQAFKVAGGILTGVGVAGVAFMADWAKSAGEAQVEMAKVGAIVETVANGSKTAFNNITKYVNQASNAYIKLGFDDETTALSFAKLFQATMDTNEANKLLALSADLARYKGVDLSTATIAVMKATQGSTKELKAMGMEVKDGATAQENLAMVQSKVAGQAKAYASTYKGAMDTLNVTISNLKENLGDRLLPTITQFVGKLIDVVTTINNMNPAMFDTIVKVTAIGTAIALIAGPILMLIGFLPALTAGFGILTTTMLPVIAIIGAVALGAVLIIKNWSTIQPLLQPALDFIINLFNTIKAGILDFVNNNMPVFQTAWEVIVAFIEYGLTFIMGIWSTIWPSIQAIFTAVWEQIKGILMVVWGAIQVIIAIGLGIISGDWTKAWTMMKEGFHDIFNGLLTYIKGWWDGIVGFFKAGINGIIGYINGFIAVINKAGKGSVNIGALPSFDNGGWVNNTGLAVVHKGEFVLSNDMLNGLRSTPSAVTKVSQSQPITINLVANTPVDLDMLNYKLAYALRNQV